MRNQADLEGFDVAELEGDRCPMRFKGCPRSLLVLPQIPVRSTPDSRHHTDGLTFGADHPMTCPARRSCIVARGAIPRWKSPGITRHRGVSSVLSVAVETGVVTIPPVPAAGVDGVLP